MIKKQGITVTVMVITIIVLIIIAGTITFSMQSTMNYSKLSVWANEMMYIQDVVDEMRNTSSTADYTLGDITVDIISASTQFEGETSEDDIVTLKVLDFGKLKITNTVYGNKETEKDVYAVSAETGKVYYVQGIDINGQIYYSVTEALKNRFNITTSSHKLSSVVFVPSVIGYSNQPINVVVKVPNTYTNIAISTSNAQIQIGSQVENESTYEYNVNSNLVAGNYVITVSYNDGTQTITSKYNVDGYDVTKPLIEGLSNANFVYKQVGDTRLEYLIDLKVTDSSGIKNIKYEMGSIDEDEAKGYFSKNTNVITDGKINLNKSTTIYTIYAEDNAGNISVLTFDKLDYISTEAVFPEEWKEWVSEVTPDGVPIPKGFVASPYGADEANGIKAENTKDGGLVIYELAEGETAIPSSETQFTSWTKRNQYVWIPVDKDNFATEFVRKDFLYATSEVVTSAGAYNALGTNYWEVIVDSENLPKTTIAEQSTTYMSTATLAEVQAMYASVKEYGGFYIARYEAGVDDANWRKSSGTAIVKTLTNVHSKMNKIPYNYIKWSSSGTMNVDTGGAVEVARSLYTSNTADTNYSKYGVVSTLTYGVQWDRTVQWFIDTNAMDEKEVNRTTGSTAYGNYLDHYIESYTELNSGARYTRSSTTKFTAVAEGYTKGSSETNVSHILTTGALKAANVNNIYDMAGNMYEWTMEGSSTGSRTSRGGNYDGGGASSPVANRGGNSPVYGNGGIGLRPSLYIKKAALAT